MLMLRLQRKGNHIFYILDTVLFLSNVLQALNKESDAIQFVLVIMVVHTVNTHIVQ